MGKDKTKKADAGAEKDTKTATTDKAADAGAKGKEKGGKKKWALPQFYPEWCGEQPSW